MTASTIDSLIAQTLEQSSAASQDHSALATQVMHNLRHQHDWTDLSMHFKPALTSKRASLSPEKNCLPRPLISGLPPRRLYTHPDEQAELIAANVADEDVQPEREWVLPSHLHERWSLARIGETFDAVSNVPPQGDDQEPPEPGRWRRTKRLVLATVDDDSTVVYYIVHDGVVKPRQN